MMNIQRLTLMMMMAVMVFGYTVSQEDEKVVLLKEIIAQAKNVSDHLTQTDNVSVYKQTEDDGSTCVKEFFCLAEKVLTSLPSKNHTRRHRRSLKTKAKHHCETPGHKDIKNLTHLLCQFNKIRNINCTLKNTNGKYQLTEFLTDVEKCADNCLTNMTACMGLP